MRTENHFQGYSYSPGHLFSSATDVANGNMYIDYCMVHNTACNGYQPLCREIVLTTARNSPPFQVAFSLMSECGRKETRTSVTHTQKKDSIRTMCLYMRV